MKTVKLKLKDLVAARSIQQTDNNSPYATIRFKLTPKKLEEFIANLSEVEHQEYIAYCESQAGKREMRDYEARERQAKRERALIRKNRIFNERFSKLKMIEKKSETFRQKLIEAKKLSLNEIAESLIVFPEMLPAGHKAPTLALARKNFKTILNDNEKDYLFYVWAETLIPLDICYSDTQQSALNETLNLES